MSTWKYAKVATFALLTWGCGMAESVEFQPKPPDGASTVGAGAETGKLDADVTALLRDKYAIVSARYYRVAGDVPWLAVAKSVQNQMAQKSIQRTMLDWYEPGIDFIEIYPQGTSGAAFALAMPKGTKTNSDKLVGFYVLGTPAGAKK
jgi:hypothetical protein